LAIFFSDSSNFFNLEKLAIEGRALIEKNRQVQIAKIEENRKSALALLNVQYAIADKVKTSFGIIGILINVITWGFIITNDLIKLLKLCYEETKEFLNEKQKEKEKINRYKCEQVEIQLEEDDEVFSKELEEKLEKIYFELVKACKKERVKREEQIN
jgi:hypothetical protein